METNLLIILGCITASLLVMLVTGSGGASKAKRLSALRARVQQKQKNQAADMSLRRKSNESTGLMQLLMKPLPDSKKLAARLERAGVALTPKQYMFRRAIWFLGVLLLLCGVLRMSPLLGISLALIGTVWLPLQVLNIKINKQNKAFLKLFPDAIDLIVRGLRSGLPVSESLVLVSEEVPNPVGAIFLNVSNTMKLGVPLEKALTDTAKRLDIQEFNFFTTSIILQRETGGNLSEILNNLSEVLRGRLIMRLKIKAMSSEARASAKIIGALPFVVALAVSVLSPEYMKPLLYDHRGNMALGIAACMMGLGLWIMNRMTKFEI